jgi:small subunit ribosomal protein S7
MPRKSRSYDKHVPEPDPKYGSVKYAKFINYIMERGKKNVARKIFYDALDIVGEKIEQVAVKATPTTPSASQTPLPGSSPGQALEKEGKTASPKVSADEKSSAPKKLDGRAVFDIALKNIAPIMELKSRRVGGANYQVPMEVMEPRRTTLSMRWLLIAARSKKGIRMAERLAGEIMDAYNKTGIAMKKREDVHRMAEANKAFAHFARFGRR